MLDQPIDTATLELILTGAGVTIAATIIASLVEVLKRAPAIGGLIRSGRDAANVAFIASAVLVGYAYLATTPKKVFMAFATPFAIFPLVVLRSGAPAIAVPPIGFPRASYWVSSCVLM